MRWLSFLLACQHLNSGTNLGECGDRSWFKVQGSSGSCVSFWLMQNVFAHSRGTNTPGWRPLVQRVSTFPHGWQSFRPYSLSVQSRLISAVMGSAAAHVSSFFSCSPGQCIRTQHRLYNPGKGKHRDVGRHTIGPLRSSQQQILHSTRSAHCQNEDKN
jgi:hypothetical protein